MPEFMQVPEDMVTNEKITHKLLIISHDVIGRTMAGPGIRYFHLARTLAMHIPTTLAMPEGSSIENKETGFKTIFYSRNEWNSIAEQVEAHTICLFPSDIATNFPELANSDAFLIVDGYDPLLAEWLALSSNATFDDQYNQWRHRLVELNAQYRVGDFYICASERQRDWWLGLLEANGRINPATFRNDPSLRRLIDVVPYGLREDKLPSPRSIIKGQWAGIESSDHLVLWGGGLWPWLDALTAIRAIAEVWKIRQDVKLIFPGSKHPNPAMAEMPTQNKMAKELAQSLGILDKAVFFGEWLPYEEWPYVLQECSIALSLHYDTLETRLAFRSRILEYIWATLPIIATCGDATSEVIEKYNLGVVVGYGDTIQVANAILGLLDQSVNLIPNWQAAHHDLTWQNAVKPIVDFCKAPSHAADKALVSGHRAADMSLQYDWGPAYVRELRRERDQWRSLADAYKRGRIMRFLSWINRTFKVRY